ncbi:MAG: DNA-binding response regulator [Gammaproteobacteria bacterium RIFCSPHIGHO2_12_FULL_40_19]|nr:MAG: DNA-binding response regulator [Gammaproteobacteria bacterium RIFCSPHIGHO2_12_FULL_40_19]
MSTLPNILIVDDDAGIRDLLSEFLKQHGFQTFVAQDGKAMRAVLERQTIELIILDIMLPGEDGLSLCRQLRSHSNIPILMLTAVGEEVDRIVGLEMGADDYLNKPFHPRELLARIKAILRRAKTPAAREVAPNADNLIYHFAGWTLNRGLRRLLSPEQLEVSLSAGEYALLLTFLERPQQVLNRDQLLDATKNRMAAPFDRSIDIQISRLRHKIEENIKNPTIIKTVRSGGYVLAVPVTADTNE